MLKVNKNHILSTVLFIFIINILSANNDFSKDTALINNYKSKLDNLIYRYPDSAALYIDSIYLLSSKNNYNYGLYMAYNSRGLYYWVKNELPQALEQYKIALKNANNINNKRPKAVLLSNIALIYANQFNRDSAINYFNKSLDYTKKYQIKDMFRKTCLDLGNFYVKHDNYILGNKYLTICYDSTINTTDSTLLYNLYLGFGILYQNVSLFEKSLESYKKSVEIDKRLSNIDNLSSLYINIGMLYFNNNVNDDSAKYYYRNALILAPEFKKNDFKLSVFVNLGNVFLRQQVFDSVKYYYERAYQMPVLNSFPDTEAAVIINLGVYYVSTKQYTKANEFLNKGYKLSDSLGLLTYKMNAVESLITLNNAINELNKSVKYYKEYIKIKDSINIINAANNIAILDFQREMKNQDKEINNLQKQNNLKHKIIFSQRIYIFLGIILFIVLVIYLLSLRKNKNKIQFLNNEVSLKNEELKSTNDLLLNKQNQLIELDKAKNKFFSIIGHDLKSPFNSLLGFLDLLTQNWDSFSDNEKYEIVNTLNTSSHNTYNLLNNLLSWGKMQQGVIKPSFVDVNLLQISKDVVDLFKNEIKAKNLTVEIAVSDNLTKKSDDIILKQIIQNLINNAIKFTPKGGNISIKSKEHNNQNSICISDTGIGFPKDMVPKVFSLDLDFNRKGTDNETSTGMGLILCGEYAKLINAKLTLESIEGKGSTFCLLF